MNYNTDPSLWTNKYYKQLWLTDNGHVVNDGCMGRFSSKEDAIACFKEAGYRIEDVTALGVTSTYAFAE